MITVANDSETLERMVVYQALYGEKGFWVRPEKMFFETIIRDGVEIPRFKEITEEEISMF
ncbi:MAG: esterase YqiA [Bacteroidetes bacterium]|nr:esterase YqiA [Bacteroidota bacterium]